MLSKTSILWMHNWYTYGWGRYVWILQKITSHDIFCNIQTCSKNGEIGCHKKVILKGVIMQEREKTLY